MSVPGTAEAVQAAVSLLPELDDGQRHQLLIASSAPIALASYALLLPSLTAYRGGWFLTDRFDPANVDDWLKNHDIAATERVVNHLHIVEDARFGHADLTEAMTGEQAMALGHYLAYGWTSWARDRYGLSIQTSVEPEEDWECIVAFWTADEGLRA